jgi:hypothetical protein
LLPEEALLFGSREDTSPTSCGGLGLQILACSVTLEVAFDGREGDPEEI